MRPTARQFVAPPRRTRIQLGTWHKFTRFEAPIQWPSSPTTRPKGGPSTHAEAKSLECRSVRGGRAELFVTDLAGRILGFGKVARFSPPAGSPTNTAPEGWYLAGLVVRPEHRRRGVGRALTLARLRWIAERSGKAYYFANESNRVSIELHAAAGFVERTRDFQYPGVHFAGGNGILFECDLELPERGRR